MNSWNSRKWKRVRIKEGGWERIVSKDNKEEKYWWNKNSRDWIRWWK